MKADRIPDISRMVPRHTVVEWKEEAGRVVVLKKRKGTIRPRLLRIFGVPPMLRVNLDPLGSEVWRLIDGARTVAAIKAALEAKFPDESQMAQRLGHFFGIMVSKGLVELG
ncbi:MAG: PqqD family protein [bacterium]